MLMEKSLKKKVMSIILSTAIILSIGGGSQNNHMSSSAATDYGVHDPAIAQNGKVTWDCIYFGNYWQEDTNEDGTADENDEKTPIKWRVLSVDGDDAFLMADQILDLKQYHSKNYEDGEFVTWGNSELRSWMNNDFVSSAFSIEEKNSIIATTVENEGTEYVPEGEKTTDKVYLPSESDLNNNEYGMFINLEGDRVKRSAKDTAYAREKYSQLPINPYGSLQDCYWLRAPSAQQVYDNGESYTFIWAFRPVLDFYFGVRPVLHINLSNNVWSKADSVSFYDAVTNTISYTVFDEQWKLQQMDSKLCYIQVDNGKMDVLGEGIEQVGLSKDGLVWSITENKETKEKELRYHNYRTNEEGKYYFEKDQNIKRLLYDQDRYVVGYTTAEGLEEKIPPCEEVATLNPTEVYWLKKIIKEQCAKGATLQDDLKDIDVYERNEDDKLIGINWNDASLKGNITLEGFSDLQSFKCKNNELTGLDISKNSKLQSLECENNKITYLNVCENPELESLDCSGNELSELDVSKNSKLQELSSENNKISELDVSSNTLLQSLKAGGKVPSTVNVGTNSLLKEIGVMGDVEVNGLYPQANKNEIPVMAGLIPKYFFNFDYNLNGGYAVKENREKNLLEKKENSVNYYGEGKKGAALNISYGEGVELPVSNLGSSYTISFWYKGNPRAYWPIFFAGTDIFDETKLKWVAVTKVEWLGGISPAIWSHSVEGTVDQFPWYGYQNSEGEWQGAEENPAANVLNAEQWNHIILTVDDSQTAEYGTKGQEVYATGSKATTYVNGRYFGTGVVVRGVYGKAARTFLNIDPWLGSNARGSYDNLAFFDRAISSSQARAIYEYESGEKLSDLDSPTSPTQKPQQTATPNDSSQSQQTVTPEPSKTQNNIKAKVSLKKARIVVKKGKKIVTKMTVKRGKKATLKVSVNSKTKIMLNKLSKKDKKVATVTLKGGKLVIKGKKKGKITLKLTARQTEKYKKTTKRIKLTIK